MVTLSLGQLFSVDMLPIYRPWATSYLASKAWPKIYMLMMVCLRPGFGWLRRLQLFATVIDTVPYCFGLYQEVGMQIEKQNELLLLSLIKCQFWFLCHKFN